MKNNGFSAGVKGISVVSAMGGKKMKRGGYGGAGAQVGLPEAVPLVSYASGMGKGLREPCSPYRQAYFFGAELNVPNADDWNCVPEIMDPTTSFDLSGIEPNHEVVVALLVVYNIPAGASHNVRFKWYRDRDSKLLFDFAYTIPNPGSYGYDSWAWYYVYSYIGYVSGEIYENGDYHVDILWDGTLLQRIGFTVSGIPVYTGKISKKELEYDESRAAIPASDIPQGKRGLVHIWGRNDTPEAQRMGIYWIVRGPPGYPDGPILEEYYAWEAWPYTSPGDAHEFIGGRFNLDEVGLYDIRAGLLMNPDAPVYVDIYYGNLCTVAAAVPEPEFSQFEIADYSVV